MEPTEIRYFSFDLAQIILVLLIDTTFFNDFRLTLGLSLVQYFFDQQLVLFPNPVFLPLEIFGDGW